MCIDHRYPEEVRQDAQRRLTLREHTEVWRLLRCYGSQALMVAAAEMQRGGRVDGPAG